VGGGVAAQLALVSRRGEHFAIAGDDGADRHVAVRLGFASALDRHGHQALAGTVRRLVRHRLESMGAGNFAGAPVLAECSPVCRDSASPYRP
jgi:hypothetical protein